MGQRKSIILNILNEHIDTIIIGAGISGLSSAYFLSKTNKSFLVLESDKEIGGTIKSRKIKNFVCEIGPNTVLMNNESIKKIIDQTDLNNNIIYPDEKKNKNRYVLVNNILTKIPTTISEFLFSKILTFKSKIFLLLEAFVPKHNKNVTVLSFIKRRFGNEIHDNIIEPFLTGIYAGDTSKMSAKHCLKLFWSLEQDYGSIILGLFKKKFDKPRSFNFSNGLGELIESLSLNFKNKIRLNTSVIDISKKGDFYKVKTNNNKQYTCKNVISTVPAFTLSNFIFDKKLSLELNKIQYSPIDVFHFGLKKKNIKNKIDGFGVLTKKNNKKNFLGILFNSSIFKELAPEGFELFTVLVGGERNSNLCELDPKLLEDIILKELNQLINHSGPVYMSNHYRWKKGIPQYNLDYDLIEDKVKSFLDQNSNFYINSNFFQGISVSDCISKSENIALRINQN